MKTVIIMGSTSDESHAKKITDKLDSYGIQWEQHAASAHKEPRKVLDILDSNKNETDLVVYITYFLNSMYCIRLKVVDVFMTLPRAGLSVKLRYFCRMQIFMAFKEKRVNFHHQLSVHRHVRLEVFSLLLQNCQ